MQKFVDVIRKYRKVLIALAFVALIAVLIWNALRQPGSPQTPPIAQVDKLYESIGTAANLKNQQNISVNIPDNLNFPAEKSLPIYQYSNEIYLNDENIEKFIKAYNLTDIKKYQTPYQGEVIIARGKDDVIIVEKGRGKLTLTKNNLKGVGDISFHQPEEYEKRAKEFISNFGISMQNYTDAKFMYENISEAKVEMGNNVVNKATDADAIQIIYEKKLGSYPVLDKSASIEPNRIGVLMDSSFNTLELSFDDSGTIGEKIKDVKLKSKDQAIKAIQEGRAKIIRADMTAEQKLVSANLFEVKLGYYPFENQLIPVYIMRSRVTLTDSGFEKNIPNPTGDLILDAIDRSVEE